MRTHASRLRGARSRVRGSRGFTLVEVTVGLMVFASAQLFLLQAFIDGMAYANRSDEVGSATTIATQVMEQIRASANPYTMVGFTDIARTPLPLPAPYNGIVNPTPHIFQVSVTVTPNSSLNLNTITINVYRPADPDGAPTATLSTMLHDQ
jgi:prepilin-type N-terminal cleavage/methylation domain-containing protein